MRIAFISLGFAPVRLSGLDISGERLVRGLLDRGHSVDIVAGTRGSIQETQNHPALRIHRVHIGPSNWIGFAVRAAQKLRELERVAPFDIIHFWDVHFAFAFRGNYVASVQQSFRQRWKFFDRENYGITAQLYHYTYYALARKIMETPAAHRAKGLLAGSIATRGEFVKYYGIAPRRVALARHGIEVGVFRRVVSHEQRRKLGIGPNEPVLLFAGFMTPRKGIEYLAKALSRIKPPPKLIIAGKWSTSSRSRFFSALGAATSQVVEAGFVPDEQMPDLYSAADIYVSPSLLEGFGLTLAEALACETPVVAVDAGATSEVVGPGGILVPSTDSDALADAVTQLLADPTRRDQMAKLGRAHIVREFDFQKMITATIGAYQEFA